ncbi:hypothetical protein PSPO01_13952 [Paraphaeosphaeria sporulosa]
MLAGARAKEELFGAVEAEEPKRRVLHAHRPGVSPQIRLCLQRGRGGCSGRAADRGQQAASCLGDPPSDEEGHVTPPARDGMVAAAGRRGLLRPMTQLTQLGCCRAGRLRRRQCRHPPGLVGCESLMLNTMCCVTVRCRADRPARRAARCRRAEDDAPGPPASTAALLPRIDSTQDNAHLRLLSKIFVELKMLPKNPVPCGYLPQHLTTVLAPIDDPFNFRTILPAFNDGAAFVMHRSKISCSNKTAAPAGPSHGLHPLSYSGTSCCPAAPCPALSQIIPLVPSPHRAT